MTSQINHLHGTAGAGIWSKREAEMRRIGSTSEDRDGAHD